MLKSMITLLKEVKSKINKSEIRTIEVIDKAIKELENKAYDSGNDKKTALLLLVILHDVIQQLPSIVALIRLFHSS